MHDEYISFFRPPHLQGLELLHACYHHQTFSRHSHDGYALGVIEDGALQFHYLRRNHVAAPGEINLVVPGECHDGQAAGPNGWTYRMLYIPVGQLQNAAQELRTTIPDFSTGVLRDPFLAARIRVAHQTLSDPATDVLYQDCVLLRLLTFWIHHHAERRGTLPKTGQEHTAVRRVKDYLAAQYQGAPHLRDIAQAAGLSPYHLLRVFAAATGQTPHAYLTQLRVDNAKNLLRSSRSLADIAADCGFADQSHLTRLFRRQYGLTPGAYRNTLQNSHAKSL